MQNCRAILPESAQLRYAVDEYDAAMNAHALVILTEWPQFSNLDLARLHQSMRYPIMIDGRNLYSLAKMSAAGFYYYSVGRPSAEPLPEAHAFAEDNSAMMENGLLNHSLTA